MSWTLEIKIPRWAKPFLRPSRYKMAWGGRSSGKSHFLAERLVEKAVENPDLQWVCIREIQRSLKFSAKKLIEDKIKTLGVAHLFDIQQAEIKRIGGDGVLIFQGMQDHTAESIKSLEGFDGAWVEEAQSLSARSLELLIPTIRKDGSELWFSWNPDQPEDAVEQLAADLAESNDAIIVGCTYLDNPWCPEVARERAEWQKRKDYERYVHIWLGGYNTKSEAQIFAGYWRVDEFEPQPQWDGPYQGIDFGFSNDPTCGIRAWIDGTRLMIEYDDGDIGLDLDETPPFLKRRIPGFEKHSTECDSARPESISYLKKHGLPRVKSVSKWSGSVEDGIEFLKTFDEIVIHERCKGMIDEARLYSYKIDRNSGKVTDKIVDDFNHRWDALRYALSNIIRRPKKSAGVW